MTRGLSPLSLVLICWGLTGIGAAWTLASLDRLDLVQTFILREGLHLSAFGWTGLNWTLLGLLIYTVADFAAGTMRKRKPATAAQLDLRRMAVITFLANMLLLAVTALWILGAAAKAGGLINLAAAAYADSLTTRDILLENKLFTGMRLFYAALPATACLAAALLATGTLPLQARRMMWSILIVNTVALFILPIVMSQRLLLLQLVLSSYIVACLIKGRVFGLQWVGCGIFLFLALWTAREAITNPIIQRPALDIAMQKLAFYLVNDMFNGFAPLSVPIPHTYGGVTLEGIMFVTFTDGYFEHLLAPKMEALDAVLGGGEFPLFTAGYVDYGPFGGAAFIAFCACIFRYAFIRASRSLGWAVVYAQIGGALLFSSHALYFTHQNFYFSIGLVAVVVLMSSKRKVTIRDVSVQMAVFRTCRRKRIMPEPLPDSLMRHMVVFSSRRHKSSHKRPAKDPSHETA